MEPTKSESLLRERLLNSVYFAGEINLLLCYSAIFQCLLLCIVGLLSITQNIYPFFFLLSTGLALVMLSCLGFVSGIAYFVLASITTITSQTNDRSHPTREIQQNNYFRYQSMFKWSSLILCTLFLISFCTFVHLSQLPDYQFINQYFEYIWLGSTCVWLLTSTCFIAYKRIKFQLNWPSRDSVTQETRIFKVRSDHRACLIGQVIYLPFFLLFVLLLIAAAS